MVVVVNIAIGGCGGHRVAVFGLGGRARRSQVWYGVVGIGALGDGGKSVVSSGDRD